MSRSDSALLRTRRRRCIDRVKLSARSGWLTAPANGRQPCRVAKSNASRLRVLVSAPRILALDEPLGALDALTRIEMQRLLEQLWLSNGFTAILVTHDVTEAVPL